MPDDFDKLNEIFGVKSDSREEGREDEVSEPVEKKSVLRKLDEALFVPDNSPPEDG